MANNDDPVFDLLDYAGWTLVRMKNEMIYHCPCGKHKVSIAGTPSDHRTRSNEYAKIMRTGCSSLPKREKPTQEPKDDGLEPGVGYICFCCKKPLKREDYRHTWVLHGGKAVCLGHKGVPDWHGREREKERALQKGIKTL